MQVAAFTGGPNVPSARARVRQYVLPLQERGINVREYPLPWGNALPKTKAFRPFWMAGTLGSRMVSLAVAAHADLSWVSRQLLPAFVPVEGLMQNPFILDVDDAVWLTSGGGRAKRLARRAEVVVCGNDFLAEYFRRWNPKVVVIPTAVDTERYRPKGVETNRQSEIVIGWTGTSQNYSYLYSIEEALLATITRFQNVRLLVVAETPPRFTKLAQSQVEFVRWTPQAELDAIGRMSIGLMPLEDSEWCRGKCSFKMLCYMACQLPVVVSPVGMNGDVLRQSDVGFGATTQEQWASALAALIEDSNLRRRMGQAGRTLIESSYSVEHLVARYSAVFHSIAS